MNRIARKKGCANIQRYYSAFRAVCKYDFMFFHRKCRKNGEQRCRARCGGIASDGPAIRTAVYGGIRSRRGVCWSALSFGQPQTGGGFASPSPPPPGEGPSQTPKFLPRDPISLAARDAISYSMRFTKCRRLVSFTAIGYRNAARRRCGEGDRKALPRGTRGIWIDYMA